MGFWLIVLGSVFLGAIACGIYLVTHVMKFRFMRRLRDERGIGRVSVIFISLGIILVPVGVLLIALGTMNAVICVIHLALFWIVCDLVAFVVRKLRKTDGEGAGIRNAQDDAVKSRKPYVAGICAVALCLLYLTCGWILAHQVSAKEYELATAKELHDSNDSDSSRGLRIIQFADAHIGTTFDASGFEKAVCKMAEYRPDIVVITGDFVDNDTPEEDFVACCEALGELRANTQYGIYYVYGNHDKSFVSNMLNARGGARVAEELKKNGVVVLEDEAVLIDGRFYVIGRQDFSRGEGPGGRASIASLTQDLDRSKYMIVLDHQPRDYSLEAAAGVDLVLSGHTHGGQMLPLAPLVGLLGSNDLVYGHERRDGTDFIVTSGISDWAIAFKTGCRSEFVVIDVK